MLALESRSACCVPRTADAFAHEHVVGHFHLYYVFGLWEKHKRVIALRLARLTSGNIINARVRSRLFFSSSLFSFSFFFSFAPDVFDAAVFVYSSRLASSSYSLGQPSFFFHPSSSSFSSFFSSSSSPRPRLKSIVHAVAAYSFSGTRGVGRFAGP